MLTDPISPAPNRWSTSSAPERPRGDVARELGLEPLPHPHTFAATADPDAAAAAAQPATPNTTAPTQRPIPAGLRTAVIGSALKFVAATSAAALPPPYLTGPHAVAVTLDGAGQDAITANDVPAAYDPDAAPPLSNPLNLLERLAADRARGRGESVRRQERRAEMLLANAGCGVGVRWDEDGRRHGVVALPPVPGEESEQEGVMLQDLRPDGRAATTTTAGTAAMTTTPALPRPMVLSEGEEAAAGLDSLPTSLGSEADSGMGILPSGGFSDQPENAGEAGEAPDSRPRRCKKAGNSVCVFALIVVALVVVIVWCGKAGAEEKTIDLGSGKLTGPIE
jgi:hypothetical protein